MRSDAIATYLEQLSLTPLEIKIYLALLEEGSMSAPSIIKRLRVHRTSVYPPLDALFAKGLISKEASGKQVFFTITEPDKSLRVLLDRTVTQKQKALTDMEANFSSFIKQLPHVPSKTTVETEAETKFYKGKAGVKTIYEEALNAHELRSYVNFEILRKAFPENETLFPEALQRNKQLKIYEFLEDTVPSRKILEEFIDANKSQDRYFYKFLPQEIKLSSVDTLIYDGKVAIINVQQQLTGVVLQNRDYFNNSKVLFDLMWNIFK